MSIVISAEMNIVKIKNLSMTNDIPHQTKLYGYCSSSQVISLSDLAGIT